MLFVVCGADCDHVGDIYECPQGTYAIGRRALLQNNFMYTKTQTTKIFVIQTTNYSWSYIIATYDVLYAASYRIFVWGGAPSVLRHTHFWEPTLL